jgi:hypothetical protein
MAAAPRAIIRIEAATTAGTIQRRLRSITALGRAMGEKKSSPAV